MLDFLRSLWRDWIRPALEAFVCAYAAEKGRQWAMA